MTLPASSMNLYGVNQGFYEIEMGFYDIEMGVYEIDGWFYEMTPSEDQMLLLRHHRSMADAELVQDSWLRDLEQTLVPLCLASARENTPRSHAEL
ncbi:hypothetical protein [Actinomyces sp. ICM54]|uniref:hypothetical protein n=1 Tax=Actinomyces sp. ICM54 TaxID=936549 RepID=UPI0012EC57D2|nr:hypothetical protein [Actinomyces sp. ICM54]